MLFQLPVKLVKHHAGLYTGRAFLLIELQQLIEIFCGIYQQGFANGLTVLGCPSASW